MGCLRYKGTARIDRCSGEEDAHDAAVIALAAQSASMLQPSLCLSNLPG